MLLESLITFLGICFTATIGSAGMAHAQSSSSESALNARQQSIIPIAAFTANGNVEKLKAALAEALQNGMAVNEIREILVQMYVNCPISKRLRRHFASKAWFSGSFGAGGRSRGRIPHEPFLRRHGFSKTPSNPRTET